LSWRNPVQNLTELGQILSSWSWSRFDPVGLWTKFGSIRPNQSNYLVSALWTQIWIHIHYFNPKWMWI